MMKDKRKALRRPMRYTAWVALATGKLHGCVLADISDTGGRIDVDSSETIPDSFMLWLASNGSARRKCRVVWRKARQIGVTFDRMPVESDSVPLVPQIAVEITPADAHAPVDTVLIDPDGVKPV
jgi:hypothetical protein